jgi:hypothetical protein
MEVSYMKGTRILLGLTIAIFIVTSSVAQETGVTKLNYGSDKWIQVHLLLQVWGQFKEYYDADPYGQGESPTDESTIDKSFFLRRARIILQGQVAKNVSFFLETEDFDAGKDDTANKGSEGSGLFTQDAFINYKIADELQIAVGLILLPFMHHNRQSAISLLGVDYNTAFVESGVKATNVWRDYGLEARGLLFNGTIDYRIGVFQGRDRATLEDKGLNTNTHDYPRYTGRIQINMKDPETGFFYSGNYLGKKKIISIGAGVDYQQQVLPAEPGTVPDDYLAWTVDLIVDHGLARGYAFALQAAYVNVSNCPETAYPVSGPAYLNSTAYFVQTGLLMSRFIQPVLKYYNVVTDKGAHTSTSHAIMGLNFYINDHNANIKAEYAYPLGDNDGTIGEKYVNVQCQIFI